MKKSRIQEDDNSGLIYKLDYIKTLPIQKYDGYFINMKEVVEKQDYLDLYHLINFDNEFSKLVRRRFQKVNDFNNFFIEIKTWFEKDTNFIFLISKKNEIKIGVCIIYNLKIISNEVKVALFLMKSYRNSKKTIESYLAILKFIFFVLKVENIKYSVYKDNEYILKMYRNKHFDFPMTEENNNFLTFILKREDILKSIQRLERYI